MSAVFGDRKQALARGRARGARQGAAAVVRRYRIAEDYYTLKELTERLGVTPSSLNRRIRRLIQAGQPLTMEALATGGTGA